MSRYARPDTLDDALSLLADEPWSVLAGGTDIYPGTGPALPGPILDIARIAPLKGITTTPGLRIGAMTSWSEIASAKLPPALRALQQAARQIGARQVQNAGTIGGNLCNASPAADGVPPLLVLDAEVELASTKGRRRLLLQEFLLGPRKTAREPGELLIAVHIPDAALTGQSAFEKLGARAHLVISIAMVAARMVVRDGHVQDVAISVGACSAVACRLPRVEAALMGRPVAGLPELVKQDDVAAALSPLTDVRATSAYRQMAATELVRNALRGLA